MAAVTWEGSMRRKLVISLIALPLFGCVKPEPENLTDWTQLALVGKTLTLIDPDLQQIFSFNKDAIVRAAFGRKGGPVSGPILYWRITDKMPLISIFPDSNVVDTFSNPVMQGANIIAPRRSCAKAVFILANSP